MNNTAVVVMTSTMDILMEDDLAEDTLLMEKATLLLNQQQQHCSSSLDLGLCKATTTSLNSKLVVEEEELDEIPLMVKSATPQQATKPKKNVRFLPDSQLTQIEYLTPRSARMMERLFYSDDDMQLLLHQLQCDVTAYERGDAYECDTFSVRGLERRTHQGSAQRARWRKLCRTVVLDEQDRQWAILPVEEPVDEQRIAFVSLEVTHKAKQLARKRAIQDELDIHQELQTQQQQGMDVSCMTDGTVASFNGSSSSLRHCNCVEDSSRHHHQMHQAAQQQQHCPTHPNNDKPRRRVHFPSSSRQMVEVFEYQHVATDQERQALWDPYLSLDDAKLQCASQIAILEQQQGLSSSSHDDDNHDDTDSTRGLESRTTLAETATEQLRSELRKALRFHPLDPVLFTKTCQKLSAKSRKQARSRGLMDQRAVKAFCFNDGNHTALKTPTKKLVTRVPKKMVRTTSPPMDTGSKRSPPSSPTTCARSTKGKQSLSSSLHSDHGSSHGTVKRGSPLTAKMAVPPKEQEQEQVTEEQPRAKRTIDVPCPLPGTTKPQPQARVRRVSDWSVGTVDTMDSTLFSSSNSTLTFQLPSGSLSSMSQVTAMEDDEDEEDDTHGEELDQVCRSSKPTRRSTMPDLSTALGLFVVPAPTTTTEPLPRRHSSAMYRLSKVTEDNDDDDDDDSEEEEDTTAAGIPKSVMIGIPNKYFGRNSKSCIQNHNSKAVAMLTNLEDSIKGQAYNQRSGDLPETDEDMDNDSTMLAESFHHDNDDDHKGGDGSGRLSGIIGRLWEKRRQGGLVRNETMNDSAL